MNDVDTLSYDPKLGEEIERLTPTEDLKKVHIGPMHQDVTKLGTLLSES